MIACLRSNGANVICITYEQEPHTMFNRLVGERVERVAVYVCNCLVTKGRVHIMFVSNGTVVHEMSERLDGTAPMSLDVRVAQSLLGCPELALWGIGGRPLPDRELLDRLLRSFYIPVRSQQERAICN